MQPLATVPWQFSRVAGALRVRSSGAAADGGRLKPGVLLQGTFSARCAPPRVGSDPDPRPVASLAVQSASAIAAPMHYSRYVVITSRTSSTFAAAGAARK